MLHHALHPLLRIALLSVLLAAVPPAPVPVALATSQHVSIADHTDAAALNYDGLIESRSAPIVADQQTSAATGSAFSLFVPPAAGVVAATGPQSLLQQSSIPERPALVYRNDFEQSITKNYAQQPAGSAWSSSGGALQQLTTSIGNRHFLGANTNGLSNDTATLTLTLPTHSIVTVDFDLYILETWDGNGLSGCPGPDRWKLMADTTTTLLDTTFANGDAAASGCSGSITQDFPKNYPSGTFPSRTGAVEKTPLVPNSTILARQMMRSIILAFPFCILLHS